MAVDMFLRIDTLEGESEDEAHGKEIEVLGWTFMGAQTGTSSVGGGAGAGKVEIQDIEIKKRVDRSSPVLYKLCASGLPLKTADLTVRKAGGTALEYMKIHLEDMIITSFKVSPEVTDDQIIETIRINFAKWGVTYTPQVAGGGGGATVSGGWDMKKNIEYSPPA